MSAKNDDDPNPPFDKKTAPKKITQSTKKQINKAGNYVFTKYQQTKSQVKKTSGHVGGKVKKTTQNVSEKMKKTTQNVSDKVKKTTQNVGGKVKKTTKNVGGKVKKPFDVVKNALETRENEVRFYFNNYMHTGNIQYENDPTANLEYLRAQSDYLQAQTPQLSDDISQGYYGQKLSDLGIAIKSAFAKNDWHYSFMEFLPQRVRIEKVIVLWHGIGSWCGDLCHIRQVTRNGIYVIAVDLLGHGASNSDAQPQKIAIPKGHIDSFASWTEQIGKVTIAIEEIVNTYLNVEVIIAGISLSGMLTTKAIYDYKDHLPQRTILISPGYAAAGGLWLGNIPILKKWRGLVNFSKRYIPSLNRNSPFYIGEVLRIIKNANFSKDLHYNNLYTGHMTKEHEEYVDRYYDELDLNRGYITTEVTDKLYKEVCKVSLLVEKLIKKGEIRDSNFFIITTGENEIDDKIICKHIIRQYMRHLSTHNNNVSHVNLNEVDDHEPIFNYGRVVNRPDSQDIMKIISSYVHENLYL
ncbi:alpha/beta fold hydrolase [Candidatus Uabimicrobium sp. HlEnr_7]|uniref:alpha/beta fold hydrolase n=1 Tax=Candidatus Uabimicrobium helgolandensis TaxID=3095367 RepID=UPI00355876D6